MIDEGSKVFGNVTRPTIRAARAARLLRLETMPAASPAVHVLFAQTAEEEGAARAEWIPSVQAKPGDEIIVVQSVGAKDGRPV